MDMVKNEQEQLANKIREFISNTRPINSNVKKEKGSIQNSTLALLKRREMVFNAFTSRTISMPVVTQFHQNIKK